MIVKLLFEKFLDLYLVIWFDFLSFYYIGFLVFNFFFKYMIFFDYRYISYLSLRVYNLIFMFINYDLLFLLINL